MIKRKIAVVELASVGSPKRLHAGPAKVFRISPEQKKIRDLQRNQFGVKTLFSTISKSVHDNSILEDSRVIAFMASHIASHVKDIKKTMRENGHVQFQARDKEFLDRMRAPYEDCRLMNGWEASTIGKQKLNNLTAKLNVEYHKQGWRSISASGGGIIAEIKRVLKWEEKNRAEVYLLVIHGVLEGLDLIGATRSTSMPTRPFTLLLP